MEQPIRAWHIGEHGEIYAGRCDEEGIKQYLREICGEKDAADQIENCFEELPQEELDRERTMHCDETGKNYRTTLRKEAEEAGSALLTQISTLYL